MKNKIKQIMWVIVMIMALWLIITVSIQRIMSPGMTETELFLNIPNAFILNFK